METKDVESFTNKYGITFNVGDYVFLPLNFYDYGIWKIVKIQDETDIGRTGRLWVDQGTDDFDPNRRHIRGFSIDNPFIKVDKECGEYLHDGDFYLEGEYATGREWKRKTE